MPPRGSQRQECSHPSRCRSMITTPRPSINAPQPRRQPISCIMRPRSACPKPVRIRSKRPSPGPWEDASSLRRRGCRTPAAGARHVAVGGLAAAGNSDLCRPPAFGPTEVRFSRGTMSGTMSSWSSWSAMADIPSAQKGYLSFGPFRNQRFPVPAPFFL